MKKFYSFLIAAIIMLAFPMGMMGQTTTYEQLTSIANIDENAQYVLGIDGTGFHYSNTSGWGLTDLPSGHTPYYYKLVVAKDGASFKAYVDTPIYGNTYYMTIPTTNAFLMTTDSTAANTDLIIGTTQVSETNYAVANKNTTARHLRRNGTSGLRSYAGTTGAMAFFYKVVTSNAPTYTVTYHANVTGINDITETYSEGEDVPVAGNSFSNPGYAFTEWNTEADGSGDSYSPEDVIEDIDDDLDLYAQWEESDENTATLTATNLELTGSYTTNTQKTIDDITYVFTDLMLNSNRIQAKASTGTIKNTTAYPGDIISVAITHDGTARATTINGSVDGEDWVQVATGSGSINADFSGKGYKYFQITRGANAAYWTKIEITYSNSSSSLDQSDLAITSPTGDLTFDLYNNTTAQVISYTTSSTGAITITPAESSYFSYVHDASAKTITVTPLAVTPSAQTVTIDQEADDNYYGGTATFTVSVVNSDPNAPGTENNPYTVAQARAAIDANTGITGVYATGIVSAIPSAWSTQYNNITFNFVDEEGDNNFLQAFRCVSTNDADASTVAVGDIVVVYGNLKKYNNTYEFDAACSLVSLTHPAVAVEAPTFSPIAGTYASAQNVTISCESPSTVIYYTLDGTEPTPNNTLYSEAISVSSTTTIKAVAYAGGDDHSTVATANYYFCSDEDPYTVTEALAFAEYQYPANGIYVTGIVSTAPTAAPTNSGQLTYYISVDGEAENQLEIYKGLGLNEAAFTAQNDIQVGDIVTVYGNVVIYGTSNPIKEFAQGNYLVSFERPTPVLEDYDLTVSTLNDHINAIYVFNIDEPNDPLIEEGQAGTVQVLEGTDIMVSPDVEEGYVLASLTVLDSEGTSVQPEDHMSDGGYYSFTMPSGPVTITATAMEAPATVDYELYSGALVEGDYIIYYNGYAMNHTVTSGRLQYETVTPNNNVITTYSAEIVWHIAPSATEGYWTIYSDDAQAYAAGTGVKNKAQMLAELNDDNNDMALWSVTVAESKDNTYEFVNKYNYANNVNHLLRNNGTNGFACYASQTGGALSLYKKVEASTETYDLTINGYGDNDQVTNGWYLIASPVATTPDQVENMRSNTYDLYRFNSTAIGAEWENYKNEEHNGFSIVPGQGYLYANSGTVTLKFSGDLYYGDGIITLENAGWNLVGNPYYETTTNIGRAFYRMNSTNNGLIAGTANDNVNAWEGIFVEATEAGETVTFTPATGAKSSSNASVVMNLSSNSNVIDRAIVNFAEGRQLSKFQLFDNSTKLCIVENGKEFAIANAEAQGEMPVNFKAATNGTYTISINTENVEMNYLHLIDNMTGDDVDLLATPSYSFNAQSTDYESRFRLVFSANDTDSDDFAFISDGSIILNGQGNVQVFDITGRMISSHNDVNSITTNGMAAGVYMLRLVNGENVKTQKIVVR